MFYKPEIREILVSRRKQLGKVSQVQAAQAVAAQIVHLAPFLKSQHLAIYIGAHGELNPQPIIHCAELLHKNIYLPVLPNKHSHQATQLEFYAYSSTDELIVNSYGLSQPNLTSRITSPHAIAPNQLELIILPLVGFDRYGNRLGRGAGHYDRTLAFTKQLPKNKRPYLIGLAYEFQRINKITPSPWDIPLDMIITEQNLYVT